MNIKNKKHLYHLMLLLYKKYNRISTRRCWTKNHLKEDVRSNYGAFNTVFQYFKEVEPEEFHNFAGMTVLQFDNLLALVRLEIQKFSNRKPLSPELKLAATLNYLHNNNNAKVSAWFFLIGKSTMYKVLHEVTKAICNALNAAYIRFPQTEEDWHSIADGFLNRFHFPHCLGAVDIKHFRIYNPPNAGVRFKNRNKQSSIGVLATCDAYRRFTWVSIGSYGSEHDALVFERSSLGQALSNDEIILPEPRLLPNSHVRCPFFFIGDGGFTLERYLLKPFRQDNMILLENKVFSARLSHARKIIECAFGVLVSKWRIGQNSLCFKLINTEMVIMACLCLHNYLISQELNLPEDERKYYLNNEDSFDYNVLSDDEAEEFDNEEDEEYEDIDDNGTGDMIRDFVKSYFVSPQGCTNWQWFKI